MIRRDYIIRMIEEFGILWARLIEQLRTGKLDTARISLDHAYMHTLGLTPSDVQTRSAGDLLARMQLGFPADAGRERCLILASLLYAEGAHAEANGNLGRAASAYRTALVIIRVTPIETTAEQQPYWPAAAELEAALARAEAA
jgi:hypothetical protein